MITSAFIGLCAIAVTAVGLAVLLLPLSAVLGVLALFHKP